MLLEEQAEAIENDADTEKDRKWMSNREIFGI